MHVIEVLYELYSQILAGLLAGLIGRPIGLDLSVEGPFPPRKSGACSASWVNLSLRCVKSRAGSTESDSYWSFGGFNYKNKRRQLRLAVFFGIEHFPVMLFLLVLFGFT